MSNKELFDEWYAQDQTKTWPGWLESKLLEARAELAELRKATEWIPVSERLPEKYEGWSFSVDVMVTDGDKIIAPAWVYLDKCHDWAGKWAYKHGGVIVELHDITHWQPLPPAPGSDEVQP